MTHRRWWLLFGTAISIEAGCVWLTWWLAHQNLTP